MKKTKKLGIMAVSVALLTAAWAVPVSATSVSGGVSGVSCSGSNSITSTGASALTSAGTAMMLNVSIEYEYIDNSTGKVIKITNQNSNSPVTQISTRRDRPSGNTRSYRCKSTHVASYGSTWTGTTTYQYY